MTTRPDGLPDRRVKADPDVPQWEERRGRPSRRVDDWTPPAPEQIAEPLSEYEERKFRDSVALLAREVPGEPLQWTNHAAARLLATLDRDRCDEHKEATDAAMNYGEGYQAALAARTQPEQPVQTAGREAGHTPLPPDGGDLRITYRASEVIALGNRRYDEGWDAALADKLAHRDPSDSGRTA